MNTRYQVQYFTSERYKELTAKELFLKNDHGACLSLEKGAVGMLAAELTHPVAKLACAR